MNPTINEILYARMCKFKTRFFYKMSSLTCIMIAMAIAIVIGVLSYFGRRYNLSMKVPRIAIAGVMIAVAAIFYIYDFEAIHNVQGLMYSPFNDLYDPFDEELLNILFTVLGVVLVWFTYAALFSTAMSEFMQYKVLKWVTRFFSLPVLIIDLALFKTLAISVIGSDAFEVFDIRLVTLPVVIGLSIGLILSRMVTDVQDRAPLLPTKAELGKFAYTLPVLLIAIMPSTVPQALLGFNLINDGIDILDMSFIHRIVLYCAIILPFIIFHAIKNKSQQEKRDIMIYLSFSFLWAYMRYWNLAELAMPYNWPLHLCNTAMFLIPLCLLFRINSLFYFTLFVNVLGAVFAILMPNYSEKYNSLAFHVVNFWLNHYAAFFMPILIMALKLFERPKLKQFGQSLIGFSGYFIAMLIVNAWFANYDPEVDFFFLNSDFIADKLGEWAENLRNITASFQIGEMTFKFYPVYQALFFLGFVAISAGVWFLFEILFTSWDEAEDRRLRERDYKNMQKELTEFLGGRSIHQPIGGDSSPHMVLKHFRKKYGRNKHYSVDDVSFEVRGGEIFGFLGPNGAGKSTIIKSVVGIQTITEGDIEICGFNVNMQPVQAKKELGFVPDHYALYENLTGREYLNYIADLYEVNQEYRDEVIERYVELFQLTGSFDNQMKTYSHGMKQKITIMAALVHNPKVWILDEPLTGLDPTSIHEVKECMKDHAAKGNIVFFSSHIIDVVEKICDKIAIIKKGKLRAVAKVSELEARGIDLEQFYLDIIYGDDSDMSVKLIGVDALEAGIDPDAAGAAVAEPTTEKAVEA